MLYLTKNCWIFSTSGFRLVLAFLIMKASRVAKRRLSRSNNRPRSSVEPATYFSRTGSSTTSSSSKISSSKLMSSSSLWANNSREQIMTKIVFNSCCILSLKRTNSKQFQGNIHDLRPATVCRCFTQQKCTLEERTTDARARKVRTITVASWLNRHRLERKNKWHCILPAQPVASITTTYLITSEIFQLPMVFMQCDQMVRLFFHIWPFASMKISPVTSQIYQSRLSILPNNNFVKNLLRLVNFCQSGNIPRNLVTLFPWKPIDYMSLGRGQPILKTRKMIALL